MSENIKDSIVGTAVKDETSGGIDDMGNNLSQAEQDKVTEANRLVREASDLLQEVFTAMMPVGRVQWIHIDQVRANDYNPNAVAGQEMKLLHTSISEDGYTQPVVAIHDPDADKYVIVDGYHRYTTMRKYRDIFESTGGYLPVVVIDKPIADRIASTVRHNRARGKHSIQGMGSLVFQMLREGETDVVICDKLGLEAEELAKLKHITGYSKLFKDQTYSRVDITKGQQEERAEYARNHPDEKMPEGV